MNIPSSIIAGDTLAFTDSSSDFPATAGWTLTYKLIPRSATNDTITFDATADGSEYAISVLAATTSAWEPDDYSWHAYVTQAGIRNTLDSGLLTIAVNPAFAEPGYDGRSQNRRTLDAIRATIEGRASKDQQEYTIGNRMLKRMDVKDLMLFEARYAALVATEERGTGPDKSRLYVRFNRA